MENYTFVRQPKINIAKVCKRPCAEPAAPVSKHPEPACRNMPLAGVTIPSQQPKVGARKPLKNVEFELLIFLKIYVPLFSSIDHNANAPTTGNLNPPKRNWRVAWLVKHRLAQRKFQ